MSTFEVRLKDEGLDGWCGYSIYDNIIVLDISHDTTGAHFFIWDKQGKSFIWAHNSYFRMILDEYYE